MSLSQVIFAFVYGICLLSSTQGEFTNGTAYYDYEHNQYYVKCGQLDKGDGSLAYGTFNDTTNTTGWGVLDVKFSGPSKSYEEDLVRMTAAGVMEGILTGERIHQTYLNNFQSFLAGKPQFAARLSEFYMKQNQWTRKMVAGNPDDPFWQGVSLVVAQLDGLLIGYNLKSCQRKTLPTLDLSAMLFLNGMGDILDLQYVLNGTSFPDIEKATPDELRNFFRMSGHCSVLIKALPGFEDIFMSHSTWFDYNSMLRIYKHYNFDLMFQGAAAKAMSFSSYPGMLESLDDFYILGSDMLMLQTTNDIYNQTLYKMVKPESLLAWQRVRVANLMANSGAEWGKIVAKYNSGTYNNQYMVVDRKRISGELLDGTLTVVEQIPGLVMSEDQTAILRAGYWPSYNIPFYETIYNLSGYPMMKKKRGNEESYQLYVRAEIFRRDQSTVTDMKSMMAIMRYNDYLHDKYSNKDPAWSICSRFDLRAKDAFAGGCTDTKITNLEMAKTFSAMAVSGPTTSHGIPVFRWTSAFNDSHIGLPESYNFPFVLMEPTL
ncbi:phospholipase B-like 1 [Patiria miniata]|uniref:Phospholipase B-like n=1 Tax=Patiria miniata TaxID=46514 RepID=A0A913Z6B3_PATMI|nr:phospholipase B-like 1 [Patiria miniata]